MLSRSSRFQVILMASAIVWATLLGADAVRAANAPPQANAWNIASTGKASSSGELLFRVTGDADTDPVEVTVFVRSGSNEDGVAGSIRRALATQLDSRRYNVSAGESGNVLLSNATGSAGFSVELVDSNVENVSVRVQNATPAAAPTVPQQQLPAAPDAPPATPAEPGNALPPPGSPPNALPPGPRPATPSAPPASPSAPPASPASPPADTSSPDPAGAGASAPPPGTPTGR